MVLFLAACGAAILQQREQFVDMDARTTSRATYGENPFLESVQIAKYIRDHGLMEQQKYALQMQKDMIAEIEQARPG